MIDTSEYELELIQDCAAVIIVLFHAEQEIPLEKLQTLEAYVRDYWGVPSHVDLAIHYADWGKRKINTAKTFGYITVLAGKKKLFTMWQHLPDNGERTLKQCREYIQHKKPAHARPNGGQI